MVQLRDGSTVEDPRLDRLVQFDRRSLEYPVTADPRMTGALRNRTWRLNMRLDQSTTPGCTGFSRTHDLAAQPKMVPGLTNDTALTLYKLAQTLDEWAGEDYEGSSVLGAAKAATAQGYIGEYRWAGVDSNTKAIDDVLLALSTIGGVVFGISWLDSMFNPRPDGTLDCSGREAGGHAIYGRSILLPRNGKITASRSFGGWRKSVTFPASEPYVGFTNSWNQSWGVLGECFVAASDLEKLLHMSGEACITTQPFARP